MVHLYMISSLLGYPDQDVLKPESRERSTVILWVQCTEIHSYPRFRPSYIDKNRQQPKRSIAAHRYCKALGRFSYILIKIESV